MTAFEEMGVEVVACVDLMQRLGSNSFEIAWACPHTPDEEDGHDCGYVVWHAIAKFKGSRATGKGTDPAGACHNLVKKCLTGGKCKCGKPSTITTKANHCLWARDGKRWESSCDAEPIHVQGQRGDITAMESAYSKARGNGPRNRRERRRKKNR